MAESHGVLHQIPNDIPLHAGLLIHLRDTHLRWLDIGERSPAGRAQLEDPATELS